MIFIPRQELFLCEHCGKEVAPLASGTYRNHCPLCLWSKHVDDLGPGDRASACGGLMEPVSIDQRSGKGWVIIHECKICSKRSPNKAAPDDDITSFFEEFST